MVDDSFIPPHAEETTENWGEFVACDFCNEGEETMGGLLTGSYAVCGDCVEKKGMLKDDYPYKDELTEIWPDNKTFRTNVLEYRLRTTGTKDAIRKTISW
jgi:hypothetical protein